jgi:lipoic acid synthetase
VITSVDRDDLRDGGAQHFVDCIRAVREHSPATQIEVLVPDFRGRLERALDVLARSPPDVMNHNLETVPRLYKQARPGSDYAHSLRLLAEFKARFTEIPTKSGLMVGLGETDDEILATMRDMRAHRIDMLTIGQYLQPTAGHLPVLRYVHPETFAMFEREAYASGFRHAAVGALVRSSYHADRQAEEVLATPPASGVAGN